MAFSGPSVRLRGHQRPAIHRATEVRVHRDIQRAEKSSESSERSENAEITQKEITQKELGV